MARRKTKNRIPEEIREIVRERSEGICEVAVPGAGCAWSGHQMHHRQLRSQGGEHLVVNLLHVCHVCHTWIHAHPQISRKNGWMVKSTGNPEQSPVKRRGGFIYLTEEGGFK